MLAQGIEALAVEPWWSQFDPQKPCEEAGFRDRHPHREVGGRGWRITQKLAGHLTWSPLYSRNKRDRAHGGGRTEMTQRCYGRHIPIHTHIHIIINSSRNEDKPG